MNEIPQQMIQKGKISTLEEPLDRNGDPSLARVLPDNAEGVVTLPITIPWWLRGKMGQLAPGTEVAFALFENGSGVIFSRMDGEWPGFVPGDVELDGSLDINEDLNIDGHTKLQDMTSSKAASYNNHKHGGVETGSSNTGTPN